MSKVSLLSILVSLRIASYFQRPDPALFDWSRNLLDVSTRERKRWCQRAWWGFEAGKLIRRQLNDPARRINVLEYIDTPDWSRFKDSYRRHKAIILAAAHVGPPKVAMHCVAEFSMPTMIWTNKRDLSDWFERESSACFLDPTSSSERPTMLLKSALHLRSKGVLMGAPDYPTGQKKITLNKFEMNLKFSLGIPALAKQLDIPVYLILALWKGCRLQLQYEPVVSPSKKINDDEWYYAWIKAYWEILEPHIRNSPENIRNGALGGIRIFGRNRV